MDNYDRISGLGPLGNPNETVENAKSVLENGGRLNENYILQEQTVLKNDLMCPDGTHYQKGYVFARGMMLPKDSVVAKPLEPNEELVSDNISNNALNLGAIKQENQEDSKVKVNGKPIWKTKLSSRKTPVISIVGVGGAGCNAVRRTAKTGVGRYANLYAFNTALGDMEMIGEDVNTGLIGEDICEGLGAGGDYEVGRKAAQGDINKIEEVLKETNLLFLVGGMGGGTGTGAMPPIAEIAKTFKDCTTIAVVTYPFDFEKGGKTDAAKKGISELRKYVDTVIVVDNKKLLELYGEQDVARALAQGDAIVTTAITSITETIYHPQTAFNEINLDYADIRTTLKNGKGNNVAVMCYGVGRDFNEAVDDAIRKPLIDVDYTNTNALLLHVVGDKSMKLNTAAEVANRLTSDKGIVNADVKFGIRTKKDMGERVEVIAIFNGVTSPQIPDGNDSIYLSTPTPETVELPGVQWISQ